MDSLSSASLNLPGRLVPKAKKMTANQIPNTTHLERRPAGKVKSERRSESIVGLPIESRLGGHGCTSARWLSAEFKAMDHLPKPDELKGAQRTLR